MTYQPSTITTSPINMNIAKTMLDQIRQADKWCLGACGGSDYVALEDGVMFRVRITSNQRHKIIIRLTPADTYTVELHKINLKAGTSVVQEKAEDVYYDTLAAIVYGMCNK